MRVLSEMLSVGAHPYGPGRNVVAGQELESGHCGVPADRARRCAESTVAVDWRTGGPSWALLPNYQCTPSYRDPSTLPRKEAWGPTSARPANATLTSARVHCVSATRGPIRPLAVLAMRKPRRHHACGLHLLGLSTPTNVAHVCFRAGQAEASHDFEQCPRRSKSSSPMTATAVDSRDEQTSTGMCVGEGRDARRCFAHRSAERAEPHWLSEWPSEPTLLKLCHR
jgi:hypothetical protein